MVFSGHDLEEGGASSVRASFRLISEYFLLVRPLTSDRSTLLSKRRLVARGHILQVEVSSVFSL